MSLAHRQKLEIGFGEFRARLLASFCTPRSEDDLRELLSSPSQLHCDLLALALARKILGSSQGTFVEVGAFDGVTDSNTYLLEKAFSWNGLLIEPVPESAGSARLRRTSLVLNAAISIASRGELPIMLGRDLRRSKAGRMRFLDDRNKRRLFVPSLSLDDAVSLAGLSEISYLSIDVEGQELQVLQGFSFRPRPMLISVEHNYRRGPRKTVNRLLKNFGYIRVLSNLSAFDDWFISDEFTDELSELAERMGSRLDPNFDLILPAS